MNNYAVLAREQKAGKMADVLHRAGISADLARLMDDSQWSCVADQAKCKAPGSEETKDAVYRILEDQPKHRMTVREWRRMTEARA